jgi:hypothetical protein
MPGNKKARVRPNKWGELALEGLLESLGRTLIVLQKTKAKDWAPEFYDPRYGTTYRKEALRRLKRLHRHLFLVINREELSNGDS